MRRLIRFVVVVLAGALLVISSLALLAPQVDTLLDANQVGRADAIDLEPLAQRSVVLAADGSLLTYLLVEENRVSVPLEEVSPTFVDTLLAIEDRRFYEHDGINVRATARALLENVEAGGVEQGGSTITQQLVKNALVGSEQSLERKVEEAVLARRLEDQMTKDEILERYLNTVYLGNSTYGVQAAAELYFGVSAKDLDVAQSALLVGLIQNPEDRNPFRYPEAARSRRDAVVERLLTIGEIDEPVARYITATPLPTEGFAIPSRPKDYFVEEVKERLLQDDRLGATQTERYNALYRGGLTIRTTVEPRLQRLADEAVSTVLPDTGGQFTASIVSIDPRSGAVRAMVGGPGFSNAQYNIATQGIGRQAGSSFKPFVLASILEQGNTVEDTVDGSGPCSFPNPAGQPDPYPVSNFERARGGVGDLRAQTLRSSNCAYVRLGIIAGIDRVIETAKRLGITRQDLAVQLSAPLGTNEVRPIDMASAYGTFANDGVHFAPYYVEEVTDRDGNVLLEGPTTGEQVLDPGVARTVTSVLADNVRSGTGTRAAFPDGRQAAGKTGTTQDSADAWFVGYTPELSTAVWMGSPVDRTPMTNVGGIRVTGGTYPARMWQAYMGPALQPYEKLAFPEPPAPDPGRAPRRLRLPSEAWAQAIAEAEARRAPPRRPTTTSPPRRSTPTTAAPESRTAPTSTAPATTASPATSAAPATTAPPATAEGAGVGDDDGDGAVGGAAHGGGNGNGNGRGNSRGGGDGSSD